MNLATDAANHPVMFYTGMLLGAAIVGLVIGLIPLAVGALTKQRKLGVQGFITCFVASLIGGAIVAIPVAAVFGIYIALKSRKQESIDEATKSS